MNLVLTGLPKPLMSLFIPEFTTLTQGARSTFSCTTSLFTQFDMRHCHVFLWSLGFVMGVEGNLCYIISAACVKTAEH
jgi:hypothetical protein